MKLEKDGLHIYGVAGDVENPYFLSVEYNLLQHNHPDTLLPVLLRDKDGRSVMLYELTDRKNMEELSGGKGFSLGDCKRLVQCIEKLLKDVEELMLSTEHIPFAPGHIYRNNKGDFQWMYCPDEKRDITQEIQEFFGWMLSVIDYGDSEAVQFMYRVYWLARNQGISKEMLRSCLEEEKKENKPCEEIDRNTDSESEDGKENNSREDGFPCEEHIKEPWMEIGGIEEWWKEQDTEKSEREERYYQGYESFYGDSGILQGIGIKTDKTEGKTAGRRRAGEWGIPMLQILSGGAAAGSFLAAVALLVLSGQSYISIQQRKYMGGLLLLCLIFGYLCFRLQGMRKRGGERRREDYSREEYAGEEGTVRLDMNYINQQPVLKNERTGEVSFLRSFPFYIGKEKKTNQLQLPDSTVSRHHAVIRRGGSMDSYMLQDLHSTNGTWMNGVRLGKEEVRLEPGSKIQFAANEFCFQILGKN